MKKRLFFICGRTRIERGKQQLFFVFVLTTRKKINPRLDVKPQKRVKTPTKFEIEMMLLAIRRRRN